MTRFGHGSPANQGRWLKLELYESYNRLLLNANPNIESYKYY